MRVEPHRSRALAARSDADAAAHPVQGKGANTMSTPAQSADDTTIRPFPIDVPQADLDELRARIAATRWPERETVADQSQGVQLATMQALARYWATEYDWRKVEARLNALPQFITEIDG